MVYIIISRMKKQILGGKNTSERIFSSAINKISALLYTLFYSMFYLLNIVFLPHLVLTPH